MCVHSDRKIEIITETKDELEQVRNTVHKLQQEVCLCLVCVCVCVCVCLHVCACLGVSRSTNLFVAIVTNVNNSMDHIIVIYALIIG